MSPKMPNSRRNLDLAIERVFDDRETALRMRRVMANVVVGQLLPDGVVKGGSAMKIRFGFAATRVSSDLDTARAKDWTVSIFRTRKHEESCRLDNHSCAA